MFLQLKSLGSWIILLPLDLSLPWKVPPHLSLRQRCRETTAALWRKERNGREGRCCPLVAFTFQSTSTGHRCGQSPVVDATSDVDCSGHWGMRQRRTDIPRIQAHRSDRRSSGMRRRAGRCRHCFPADRDTAIDTLLWKLSLGVHF